MKIAKVVPHIPFYKLGSNRVEYYWNEEFEDRLGNKATLVKVSYLIKSKKGKEERHEAVIQVIWYDQ